MTGYITLSEITSFKSFSYFTIFT